MASGNGIRPDPSETSGTREHLSQLRDEAGNVAKHVAEGARTALDEAKNYATDRAAAARDYARDRAEAAREVGSEWVDEVDAYIRQKPLTSVAIALGVGFVLSKLISR